MSVLAKLLVFGGLGALGLYAISGESKDSPGPGTGGGTSDGDKTKVINTEPPGGNKVPPPTNGSRTYTVKAGDTEWGIAQRLTGNGARYPELEKANPQKPLSYVYRDKNGKMYLSSTYGAVAYRNTDTGQVLTYASTADPNFSPDAGFERLSFAGTQFQTLRAGEVLNLPSNW